MDDAVVTGAFTLAAGFGGVVLGSVVTAIQTSAADRKSDAAQRDAQFAALGKAATQLLLELRLVRQLKLPRLLAGKMAEQLRDVLLPRIAEVTEQATRLSLGRDRRIREASGRVAGACGGLMEHAFDLEAIGEHEAGLQKALKALRDARDLAATPRWHWRKRAELKRRLTEAPRLLGNEAGEAVAPGGDQGIKSAENSEAPG